MRDRLGFGVVTIYRGDRWVRSFAWFFFIVMVSCFVGYIFKGFTSGFCDADDRTSDCIISILLMCFATLGSAAFVWFAMLHPKPRRIVLHISDAEIAAPEHTVSAAAMFGVYVASGQEADTLTLWFVNTDMEVFDTVVTGWGETGYRLEGVLAKHGYNVLPPDWRDTDQTEA